MSFLKYISISIFACVLFLQCSSAQKLQKKISFKIDKAYYQHWIAGVKDGGSGTNIFITVTDLDNNIKLDSLYFKWHKVAFEVKPNSPNLYIARIITKANQKEGFISQTKTEPPFQLNENEGILVYTENNKTKYYKITNITEKQSEYLPSVPPKQN